MSAVSWPPRFEAVLRSYLKIGDGDPISPESSLSEQGLDSMGTVNLLLDLEAEYAVTIPDEHLMHFGTATVDGLWAMIEHAGAGADVEGVTR